MRRAWHFRWVVLAGLAVAGCASEQQDSSIQGIYSDQFSTFVEVDGASHSITVIGGPTMNWSLTSFIDKTSRAVTYRIDFDYWNLYSVPRFDTASDDAARPLPVMRVSRRRDCDPMPCSTDEDVAVMLDANTLLARQATGYAVKVVARDGSAYVLTITPDMIVKQVAAVNQVLARLGPPPQPVAVTPPAPVPAPAAPAPAMASVATPPPPAFAGRELGLRVSSDMVAVADSKTKGIKVTGIEPGSIADQAGLQVGDLIVACDGAPLRSVQDLQRKTGAITGHGSVTVLVVHPDTGLQSTFILGR
jgi:hypothetical protein